LVALFLAHHAVVAQLDDTCSSSVDSLCSSSADFDACATCIKNNKEAIEGACSVGGLTVVGEYCANKALTESVGDGEEVADPVAALEPGTEDGDEAMAKLKFKQFDINGSGVIEENEIRALISSVMGEEPGPETLSEAVQCLDPQGTGQITFAAFQHWFFGDDESASEGMAVDEPVQPVPYISVDDAPMQDSMADADADACYTCECLPGYTSDPFDRTKCQGTSIPTSIPTTSPTSGAPTTAPTYMPTGCACEDGSHLCDLMTTRCEQEGDDPYNCFCLEGFVENPATDTSCLATPAPTPSTAEIEAEMYVPTPATLDGSFTCADGSLCYAGMCADGSVCIATDGGDGGGEISAEDFSCTDGSTCYGGVCEDGSVCGKGDGTACFDGSFCYNGLCENKMACSDSNCFDGSLCTDGKCVDGSLCGGFPSPSPTHVPTAGVPCTDGPRDCDPDTSTCQQLCYPEDHPIHKCVCKEGFAYDPLHPTTCRATAPPTRPPTRSPSDLPSTRAPSQFPTEVSKRVSNMNLGYDMRDS
jgi:hypothetical protein